MDLYYKQEVGVGLLVIVGIAAFFGGMMWLTGRSLGGGRVEVPVLFSDVGNLTEGDPVHVSGVQVGRVERARLEEEGRVLITLQVGQRYSPKIDATAAIKSLDFLGAKFVEYSPGRSDTPLPEGQLLQGSSGSDIAETASRLAGEGVEVLVGAQRMLSTEMADDIRRTLQASERALNTIASIGQTGLVDEARGSFRSLQAVAMRLDSTLANPAINESISQLDELTENVSEMTQGLAGATMALSAMLQQMNDTTGSMGRLLNDTTIHTDLHELLVSMRKLLDDVRERPGRYVNITVF